MGDIPTPEEWDRAAGIQVVDGFQFLSIGYMVSVSELNSFRS